MKRWNIYLPDGKVGKFYYKTREEAEKSFPEAIKIEENIDLSYLLYVDIIKNASTRSFKDYRGREVWGIPHNHGEILYRPFFDEDGKYIDGCEFQRMDCIGTIVPTMWDLSNPKKFFETFLSDKDHDSCDIHLVSKNFLRSRKAKLFFNKNGKCYWKDQDGMFYIAEKHWLPSKSDVEEYKAFHDSKEAVFVSYGTEVAFQKTQWFNSFSEFKAFFDELLSQNSSMRYDVRRYGYRKLPPEDRGCIIALPYINLDTEIRVAKTSTANENYVSRMVANSWIKKSDLYRDMVEQLISVYAEKMYE